jgi:hypothetical protein
LLPAVIHYRYHVFAGRQPFTFVDVMCCSLPYLVSKTTLFVFVFSAGVLTLAMWRILVVAKHEK